MLKVFFGEHSTSESIARHIEKFRSHVKEQLKGYEKILQNSTLNDVQSNKIYRLLALKAGILGAQSKLQWCEEALNLLKGQ